jgi:hypothetical protein
MLSFVIALAAPVVFIGLWVFMIRKRGLEFQKLAASGMEAKATVVTKASVRGRSKGAGCT